MTPLIPAWFALLLGLHTVWAAGPTLPIRTIEDLPLPGDTSRFDYASVDPSRHRLYVAHLGADEMVVVDTAHDRVAGVVRGLRQVHGVLAVPELGRVYATATGSNEVVAIDADTLAVIARTPTGRYPDGMAYANTAQKLYVSNKLGDSDTVVDVRSHHVVTTIELGGEVGNTQYDPASQRVFVNVQSRHQLVEIDPARDTVVGRYEVAGAQGNHGLFLLPTPHLALIACEDNDTLLAFDLTSHAVLQHWRVGEGPDVLAMDETQQRVYLASESGVVSVFGVKDRTLDKIGESHLAPAAHVVAVDPVTHRLYFPLQNSAGRPVLRVAEPIIP